MSRRVLGVVTGSRRVPQAVDVRAAADGQEVVVDLVSENARRDERSVRLRISPTAARELMRALQGAADRADREAYLAFKAQGLGWAAESMRRDAAEVAAALGGDL